MDEEWLYFRWASQPADRLTLKSWIMEEMRKRGNEEKRKGGEEEKRKKGKDERRKDVKG